MDTADLHFKCEGVQLIKEPGYTIKELQENIKGSCLEDKFYYILNTENLSVEEVYTYVLNLLDTELSLDEITSLFVVVGMLYFIHPIPSNLEWRNYLLQKTFNYTDTLNPVHIHFATKKLWQGLKKKDGDAFNLLTLCDQILIASDTARAISISIMWAILSEITETKIDLYCFRRFSTILEMLQKTDNESLMDDESMPNVYVLVLVIMFLINSAVYDGQNEHLKKVGYRRYLEYTYCDLRSLLEWCEQLLQIVKSSTKHVDAQQGSDVTELRMLITRQITFDIINVLQERMNEMHHE